MKSYEEMAEQVFIKSEKEIEKRNIWKRKFRKIAFSISGVCIVIICIGVYSNRLFNSDQSVNKEDQIVEVDKSGTDIDKEYAPQTDNITFQNEKTEPMQETLRMSSAKTEETNSVNISDDVETTAGEFFTGISPKQAQENAKAKLSDEEIKTITNIDSPKIEEIVFKDKPSIYLFDENINVEGKPLYKIIYNTEQDGLLGPITRYVDRESGEVIGADFRE